MVVVEVMVAGGFGGHRQIRRVGGAQELGERPGEQRGAAERGGGSGHFPDAAADGGPSDGSCDRLRQLGTASRAPAKRDTVSLTPLFLCKSLLFFDLSLASRWPPTSSPSPRLPSIILLWVRSLCAASILQETLHVHSPQARRAAPGADPALLFTCAAEPPAPSAPSSGLKTHCPDFPQNPVSALVLSRQQ
uniref:Uncharacterized protein n=1 Tax=Knipowitschia caucasica TaxID=637954 RepID=A0AAV2K9N4_KNICA